MNGASRGRAGAGASRDPRADEEPPEEYPDEGYPDEDPGEANGPAAQLDPEAQALDLLKTGLGARPIEG